MSLKPYKYQSDGVNEIASNFSKGIRRQIFQLPTGAGKTVVFSYMVQRYLNAMNKTVVIAVHRDELLKQTRKTLFNHFGINSEAITAKNRQLNQSKVYVCMVETLHNRLKKRQEYIKNVGMLIVDECHIGNFKKLYDYYQDPLIVGLSATPISASKKDPLKNHFDEIVVGPQIDELIKFGSLTQNETYGIKGFDRDSLNVKRGRFDESDMAKKYSKVKHVSNVVDAYERLCQGLKTMVFNCNVEHSKLVTEAFINAGYESRHLDGESADRKEVLEWFHNTPNAILNNIAVLTTGFDEPSVRNVIINRSTMSLPLWLQMSGRGSRIYPTKDYWRLIDMGGNAVKFGDWRMSRDWYTHFHFPDRPSDGEGVAPIKSCDGCEAIITASARVCAFCGHIHERVIEYDTIAPEFEKLVGLINVGRIATNVEEKGHKEWTTFFKILDQSMKGLQYQISDTYMSTEDIDKAFKTFETKVKEWRKIINKPYGRHVKEFARIKFEEELKKAQMIAA